MDNLVEQQCGFIFIADQIDALILAHPTGSIAATYWAARIKAAELHQLEDQDYYLNLLAQEKKQQAEDELQFAIKLEQSNMVMKRIFKDPSKEPWIEAELNEDNSQEVIQYSLLNLLHDLANHVDKLRRIEIQITDLKDKQTILLDNMKQFQKNYVDNFFEKLMDKPHQIQFGDKAFKFQLVHDDELTEMKKTFENRPVTAKEKLHRLAQNDVNHPRLLCYHELKQSAKSRYIKQGALEIDAEKQAAEYANRQLKLHDNSMLNELLLVQKLANSFKKNHKAAIEYYRDDVKKAGGLFAIMRNYCHHLDDERQGYIDRCQKQDKHYQDNAIDLHHLILSKKKKLKKDIKPLLNLIMQYNKDPRINRFIQVNFNNLDKKHEAIHHVTELES